MEALAKASPAEVGQIFASLPWVVSVESEPLSDGQLSCKGGNYLGSKARTIGPSDLVALF